MRRLIIEEPVSRAAVWGRRVALFSLPVFVAGVVLARGGGADRDAGLAVIGASALLAFAGLLLAIAALARIWREGRRGLGAAVQALAVSAAVLALPGFFALRLISTPYYADLTTDTLNPPPFSRSPAAWAAREGLAPQSPPPSPAAAPAPGPDWARAEPWALVTHWTGAAREQAREWANALPMPATNPARLREMQRNAHPAFRPLRTELPADEAFRRAQAAASAQGWTIIERAPPGGRFDLGHIDAVYHSALLRLPVDVTVRLRIHAEGTTIDVRSVPRYRLFDIGTGPRGLERFLEAITAEPGADAD